jgi:hypothetical protein
MTSRHFTKKYPKNVTPKGNMYIFVPFFVHELKVTPKGNMYIFVPFLFTN